MVMAISMLYLYRLTEELCKKILKNIQNVDLKYLEFFLHILNFDVDLMNNLMMIQPP